MIIAHAPVFVKQKFKIIDDCSCNRQLWKMAMAGALEHIICKRGEKHYGAGGLLMGSVGLMGDVFKAGGNSSFAKRNPCQRRQGLPAVFAFYDGSFFM